ncbi:hypothetical protein HID58_037455 [Brassica napus]|uniref:Uncharacterized protein n=1 Tax=Brassica napus TaxID=3708 RepID=A0ABQ8BLR1_BRANA|nr:hypothetical protein HID58_037455 [Brassica napus]
MNMCIAQNRLAVLQEQSLAIEFNWFWFHSCKQFEAISMIKIQSYGNQAEIKVQRFLVKRVLGYCITSLQLQRKEMSNNNYLGVDSAWNCVSDSENPTCAAYRLAVIADPGSTFRGIVAANVKVDKGFFATKRKDIYCVTDHNLTICFTQNIVLSELQYNPVVIDRNMFRFRSFQEFEGFNESLATLAVVLVTAVNTKRIGDGELIVFSGVKMYRAEISVYNNVVKATLCSLANRDIGANHEMPTPQCLVEVSSSNLKRQTIIVTRVVFPAVLPPFVVAESQPDAIDEESTCSWINSFLS